MRPVIHKFFNFQGSSCNLEQEVWLRGKDNPNPHAGPRKVQGSRTVVAPGVLGLACRVSHVALVVSNSSALKAALVRMPNRNSHEQGLQDGVTRLVRTPATPRTSWKLLAEKGGASGPSGSSSSQHRRSFIHRRTLDLVCRTF